MAWRSSLPLRRSCVDDVRGKELLACLELVCDRATSDGCSSLPIRLCRRIDMLEKRLENLEKKTGR